MLEKSAPGKFVAHSSKFVLPLISMRICCAESKGRAYVFLEKCRTAVEKRTQMQKELEEEQIYLEIEKAKAEWERAVRQFEAQGKMKLIMLSMFWKQQSASTRFI